MLSRRPRSWAIPGRGIWAGLALTPILIALVALIAASIGGGATATAGRSSSAAIMNQATRLRPATHNTARPGAAFRYWTRARIANATDVVSGRRLGPTGTPGSPNTTFNWYPSTNSQPIRRTVLLLFRQNGNDHTCTGGVISYDNPPGPPVEGPRNVVWTAGRCVHDGQNATTGWSTNVLACPGHHASGPAPPDGCYEWDSLSTTPEWYTDNWESRDYGVVFTRACGNPPGFGCVNGTNIADRTQAYNFAYNQGPNVHWWVTAMHHAGNNLPPPAPACGGDPGGYASSCATERVTQAQYAYSHAALPPNPAAGAPDTGPLVNSIGANVQQAGVDSTRLTGPCAANPYLPGLPCTGMGTGAPWTLNWNGNESRFGKVVINSNTSYADAGEDDIAAGQMQGPYYDTVTCFDYQAWVPNFPGPC